MEKLWKEFLFTRGILVCEVGGKIKDPVSEETLASRFGIKLALRSEEVHPKMLPFIEEQLGGDMPNGFYQYFPASVRKMSPVFLKYEQTCLYLEHEAGDPCSKPVAHSMLEGEGTHTEFAEEVPPKYFLVASEAKAKHLLDLMLTRMFYCPKPLTSMQYRVLLSCIKTKFCELTHCECKHTLHRLVVDTRNPAYAKLLSLSDVLEVAKLLSHKNAAPTSSAKFKLSNQDRKFVTRLMDDIFQNDEACDIEKCFEQKAKWCGLLHHIHYTPTTMEALAFVNAMRGDQNYSAMAVVERALKGGDVHSATQILYDAKGSDGVLAHLLDLVGHCHYAKDISEVLCYIKDGSVWQLMKTYMAILNFDVKPSNAQRTVTYIKHGNQVCHAAKHPQYPYPITQKRLDKLTVAVEAELIKALYDRTFHTYVSPQMYQVAMPVYNETISGYGVMPRGSQVILPPDKKVRFFTSWKGKYDVDLSLVGLTDEGERVEFSWRTMYQNQSDAIAYSGDALAGDGACAEYADVDLSAFAEKYPNIKYLMVCQNMYTGHSFDRCPCRTGYMLRDKADTGRVFEPKTLQSIFDVDCNASFVQLFGLDVRAGKLVWLLSPQANHAKLAAKADFDLLITSLKIAEKLNVAWVLKHTDCFPMSDPERSFVAFGDDLHIQRFQNETLRSCDAIDILSILIQPRFEETADELLGEDCDDD